MDKEAGGGDPDGGGEAGGGDCITYAFECVCVCVSINIHTYKYIHIYRPHIYVCKYKLTDSVVTAVVVQRR